MVAFATDYTYSMKDQVILTDELVREATGYN